MGDILKALGELVGYYILTVLLYLIRNVIKPICPFPKFTLLLLAGLLKLKIWGRQYVWGKS